MTMNEATQTIRSLRQMVAFAPIRSELHHVEVTLALDLQHDQHRIQFRNGAQVHSLDINNSTPARVFAHFRGFAGVPV